MSLFFYYKWYNFMKMIDVPLTFFLCYSGPKCPYPFHKLIFIGRFDLFSQESLEFVPHILNGIEIMQPFISLLRTCVGLMAAPPEDEKWYCPSCLLRKEKKKGKSKKKS